MRPHSTFLLALGVLALPSTATAQQRRSDVFTTADGVKLHYLVQGSGPPLLLLHGFALSADINWVDPGALDSLATAFTVIVPDLRGHGASDKPQDTAAYGTHFVDDILGLLDHLRIQTAHVAGYSMGGFITLRLVATHPERVRSAALGGSGWSAPGGTPPPQRVAWLANLDRAARDHSSVAEALRPPNAPQLPAPIVEQLDRNDPLALIAVLQSVDAIAVPEREVRAIRVPMHAVVGENDIGTRTTVDALARLVPQLTVTIIPGTDHRTAIHHPLLAAAIRDFARAH